MALQKMLKSMDEIKNDQQIHRSKSRKHNFSPDKVITINRKSSRSPNPFRFNIKKNQSPLRVLQSQSPPRLLVSQHLDQMKNTQKAVEAAMKIKKISQPKKHSKVVTARMKGKSPVRRRKTSSSPKSTSVMHQYGGVNLVLPIQQNVEQQQNHDQITLMEISDVLSTKIDRI